ncbi:hypothetical protein [Mycobacterium sp. ACS4331]|uniref:hypothetical protein n=1 Tax=Mycobacterium sp. ACS4331 TaxID=1834121 RepID=UPI0007FF136E|nr:hypothetical protein [Mycobacterium sp. ACS4331]OBF29658.1 hypothetical protein A5727_23560 [Mycobacterium sp. ACS4331]
MNQLLLTGKPALLTHALPGLLRRWWDEIRWADRAMWRPADRRERRKRRHYPVQRDRVFEHAAMAREMYRL